MYYKCCVRNCTSTREDAILHKFPMDKIKMYEWIKRLKDDSLRGLCLYKLFVCSKHFEDKFITSKSRLRYNAYPTLFTTKEISSGRPERANVIPSLPKDDHNYSRKRHTDHNYCVDSMYTAACVGLQNYGLVEISSTDLSVNNYSKDSSTNHSAENSLPNDSLIKDNSRKVDYSITEGYLEKEDYSSKEDYSTNEDYPAKEDYLAKEEYSSKEDYSTNEDYPAKEDYLAKEEYSSKEDYSTKEDHMRKEDYPTKDFKTINHSSKDCTLKHYSPKVCLEDLLDHNPKPVLYLAPLQEEYESDDAEMPDSDGNSRDTTWNNINSEDIHRLMQHQEHLQSEVVRLRVELQQLQSLRQSQVIQDLQKLVNETVKVLSSGSEEVRRLRAKNLHLEQQLAQLRQQQQNAEDRELLRSMSSRYSGP